MIVRLMVVWETAEAAERLERAEETLAEMVEEYPWLPQLEELLDHIRYARAHLDVHELPGDGSPPQ